MNELIIGGRTFGSRLFVGTGKFRSNDEMANAIAASGTEMVTVAMKRVDMTNPADDMLTHVRRPGIQLLPNTSGVRNAEAKPYWRTARPRGLQHQIHKTRNTPRPQSTFYPTRWKRCEPPKNWLNGICGAAIHPGRPSAVQTPRRSRRCHGDATRRPHWH